MRPVLLGFLLVGVLHATSYYVTIAGLGGTPEYEAQFTKWASDMDRAFRSNGPEAQVQTITGPAATSKQVKDTLTRLAGEAKADDSVAVLLIGHGSFDGTDYKFNIPGPDITATELATLLDRIPARRQLIVVMTSASGGSFRPLEKKGRIVITATKSGTEKNATVFARYWVDALRDPAADTDKSGSVSALEAFRYAESKTVAYFEAEKLLATEHALLDDTGSGSGVREPSPANGQGLASAAFVLVGPPTVNAETPTSGKQKLLAKKQDLESKIDKLKYEKAAMPSDEYKRQLTALLLELAKTQAEIDR